MSKHSLGPQPPIHATNEEGDCAYWCRGCTWREDRDLPTDWEEDDLDEEQGATMSEHRPGPWRLADDGVIVDAHDKEITQEVMLTIRAERDEAMDLLREALACVDQEDYRLSDRICAFFARVDGGQT